MADERPDQADDQSVMQAALPYVAPYAIFMVLTFAADYAPAWRSVIYIAKVLAVAGALWYYRRAYTELRPRVSVATLAAAGVGVLVIVAWVGLDPYYPQSGDEWRALISEGPQRFEHASKVQGQFDPTAEGQAVPPLVAIVFRLIGAVLLVPVFEELFVRSWLIRFVVNDNFRKVPVGTFTWASFAVTVGLFGIAHHEWLAGIICGAAFNLILYWSKDVFQCIVAHAVANLALAVWVLTQGAWMFW